MWEYRCFHAIVLLDNWDSTYEWGISPVKLDITTSLFSLERWLVRAKYPPNGVNLDWIDVSHPLFIYIYIYMICIHIILLLLRLLLALLDTPLASTCRIQLVVAQAMRVGSVFVNPWVIHVAWSSKSYLAKTWSIWFVFVGCAMVCFGKNLLGPGQLSQHIYPLMFPIWNVLCAYCNVLHDDLHLLIPDIRTLWNLIIESEQWKIHCFPISLLVGGLEHEF